MMQIHSHANCNDDTQQTVLGVADGTITDEKTINEVFNHLTECKYCRQLYEDYFLVVEEDVVDDIDTDDIFSFEFTFNKNNNSFVPVTSNKYILQPQVQVLAQPNVPVVDIEYPFKDSMIRLKIIYNNQAIDIGIYYPENGLKIYLLTGSKFDVATIDNHNAYFSAIEPGTIVLLFEFKKIVKIHIQI